jgi:hypothetical protein
VEHSFAIFWGLGKSAWLAGRAKNRKLFRWNVTWASIFLFKEWRHKLICNFLLRPRWGCSNKSGPLLQSCVTVTEHQKVAPPSRIA